MKFIKLSLEDSGGRRLAVSLNQSRFEIEGFVTVDKIVIGGTTIADHDAQLPIVLAEGAKLIIEVLPAGAVELAGGATEPDCVVVS